MLQLTTADRAGTCAASGEAILKSHYKIGVPGKRAGRTFWMAPAAFISRLSFADDKVGAAARSTMATPPRRTRYPDVHHAPAHRRAYVLLRPAP